MSQVPDTSRQSLEDFAVHAGVSKRGGYICTTHARALLGALRTIYWMHEVRLRLGVETGYAVEKLVEPEGFRRNELGETVRRNKWSKYRRGLMHPSVGMLRKTELLAPGSTAVYKSSFWSAIAIDIRVDDDLEPWFSAFNHSVQGLCREILPTRLQAKPHHWRLNKVKLASLLRRLDLDVLAFLTVLLKVCRAHARLDAAEEASHFLYCGLLIHSAAFVERGTAEPLYQYFVRHLLPLGWRPGTRKVYLPLAFCRAAVLLEYMLSKIEGVDANRLSEEQRNTLLLRILQGHYGFDWLQVFRELEVPDLRSSTLNKVDLLRLWLDMAFREDGLIGTFYRRERTDPYDAIRKFGPISRDDWQTLHANGQELALALAQGRIRINGSQMERSTPARQVNDLG